MAAKSSRFEIRSDPEASRRIRHAAELTRQSVSSFVLAAACQRADQVISERSTTLLDPVSFDRLWDALDAEPQPDPNLARHASDPRRYQRA